MARGNQKREGKKDPDLQGRINIDGTERWISGWFFAYEKDGEKKRGISLSLGKVVEGKAAPKQKRPANDMDSDIPF